MIFASYPSSALPANMTVINNTTEVQRSIHSVLARKRSRTAAPTHLGTSTATPSRITTSSPPVSTARGTMVTTALAPVTALLAAQRAARPAFLATANATPPVTARRASTMAETVGRYRHPLSPTMLMMTTTTARPPPAVSAPRPTRTASATETDGASACQTPTPTARSRRACTPTDPGINGGSGCGEHGTLFPPSFGGPNCGESHPDGKVAAVENVAKGLAIGIIIAIVVGGVIGGLLLILLLKCLLMAICK